MQKSPTQTTRFMINVEAVDSGRLDPSLMRSGIAQALEIARSEGMLTAVDDDSTHIGTITVNTFPNLVDTLQLLLRDHIADSPAARTDIEFALSKIIRHHTRDRVTILTADERADLIEAMAATRKDWQSSGEDDWISDVVEHGYDGYGSETDQGLIEQAFCDNPVFAHLSNDHVRLGFLRILVKPAVVDLICRTQPEIDIDEVNAQLRQSLAPMFAPNTTTLQADAAEADALFEKAISSLKARINWNNESEESCAPQG